MQSAPTEASQTATSVDQSSSSPAFTQHGLPDIPLQASDTLFREDVRVPRVDRLDDNDAASVSSGGTSRGRQSHARRISSRHTSSQESSPGSRIDEYERAYATICKPSDGMIFHVIPNSTTSNVSIQEFPNGLDLIYPLSQPLTYLKRS